MDQRLDDVVLRALEKEPAERYQQASQVRTAVENIAAGGGGAATPKAARPPSSFPASSAPIKPRLSRTAIGGVVMLLPWLAVLSFIKFPYSPPPLNFSQDGAMLRLLVIFYVCLLGTTISMTALGWIAVMEIRHSAGRIYGLALAIFDLLLFPLLALDFFLVNLGVHSGLALSRAALVALAIDALLAWLVWRKARTPPSGPRTLLSVVRIVFFFVFSAAFLGFVGGGLLTTPQYYAAATVHLLRGSANAPQVATPEDFNTQIRLMESDGVAQAVADRLKPDERKRFLAPFGSTLSFDQPASTITDLLLQGRDVTPIPMSLMMEVGFEHPNKEIAATIANYFAEEFINSILRTNTATSMQLVEDLNLRAEQQRKKVEAIQNKINDMVQKNGELAQSPGNSQLAGFKDYAALKRNLDVATNMYKSILASEEELQRRPFGMSIPYRIVDRAGVPAEPFEPDMSKVIFFGFVIGMIGATVAAVCAAVQWGISRRRRAA
jgi:hypothetical protein